jgi:Inorganic pyrophosphatase
LPGSPILTTGVLPSTRAEDGDPLDVLIIHDAATYPGLVLKCKPIGVLEVVQTSKGKKERNDRVFVEGDRGVREILRGDRPLESKNLSSRGGAVPPRLSRQ